MPGTATRGHFRGRLLSAVLGVAAFGAGALAVGAVFAEDGGGGRSHSRHGGGGGGGSRMPDWSAPQWHPQQQDNRRLVSPMGSAANVPSGYYQQNLGWNGPPMEYGPIVIPSLPYVTLGQPLYTPPEPPKVVVVNQVTVNNPPPVVIEQPRYERPRYEERQQPAEPVAPPVPRPTAPQKVVFDISPADALVKLDGKKLGTAADLGSPGEPLQLSPGVYILQVDHPSYKTQRLVFGVSAERVRVEVDLAADDPSGRARVH